MPGCARSNRLLVIEVGAGTDIPTARLMGERDERTIDPHQSDAAQVANDKGVAMAAGALAALRSIAASLV
jgi:hypothetical protein